MPRFKNGKILRISCTGFCQIHEIGSRNFGRRHDGTRGKHTETLKNGSRARLWQNSANFVTLAGFCQVREFGTVQEFGRRNTKINTHGYPPPELPFGSEMVLNSFSSSCNPKGINIAP